MRLNAAREQESKHVVDVLLGVTNDNETSVADLEQALEQSTKNYHALRNLIATLERERIAADREQHNCILDRDSALAQALQTNSQVITL